MECGRSDGGGGVSYVTNISVDGGRKSVRLADPESQGVVNDLVRQLARARSVAMRSS